MPKLSVALAFVFGILGSAAWVVTERLGGAEAVPGQSAEVRVTSAHSPPAPPTVKPPSCLERIESAKRSPASPGTPELDARRVRLVTSVKAEPVLFLARPPEAPADAPELTYFRGRLANDNAHEAVRAVLNASKLRKDLARKLLLQDGYLYAEAPALAAALVDQVELADLFDAPVVLVARGNQSFRVERGEDGYVYAEGPRAKQRFELILWDRVWAADAPLGPPLHRSLTELEALGFDSLGLIHLTPEQAVVEARYGAVLVPTLLEARGAGFEFGCESVPREAEQALSEARERARRQALALTRLRAVMERMVQESLPFDEPKTEDGQQDGHLRPEWRWAYLRGADRYEFNGDEYRVFDALGRPRVPQVCVDFVMDTFERASGHWWRGRGEARERTLGTFDFEAFGIENRRSVEAFVNFAWDHPEWFDVIDLPPEERIPFGRREAFLGHLLEHGARYQPGDVVTIHGLKDDGKPHYHSFVVFTRDPLTGVPTWVAANAGRPRIRTWDQEVRNAPKRSIKSRVRPRLEWLEQILGTHAI
jgi:hypothetical protein